MQNITPEILDLNEEEILQKIDDEIEAEETLLQSKMTRKERKRMCSLERIFIKNLVSESDDRLEPNQHNNHKNDIKGYKKFSDYRNKMKKKYIVPTQVKNNSTMN